MPSRLPKPALSSTEHVEHSIERVPSIPYGLECAALEPGGTLVAWNAKGEAVEISPEDRHAVVSLLLQGQIQPNHLRALLRATITPLRADDTKHRKALLDLFRQLVVYLPPDGYHEIVNSWDVMAATRIAIAGVRCEQPIPFDVMQVPPAILFTINTEGVITACVGTALSIVKDALTPPVTQATIQNTFDDAQSPIHAALENVLQGEASAFRATFAGHDWAVQIEPLRNEKDEIVGAVAYATLASVVQTTAPVDEHEAFPHYEHQRAHPTLLDASPACKRSCM